MIDLIDNLEISEMTSRRYPCMHCDYTSAIFSPTTHAYDYTVQYQQPAPRHDVSFLYL